MSVGGSFTQTSTGTLREHFGSKLSVGGALNLGGGLDMLVDGDCPPRPGQIATAITATGRAGTFATHNSPFSVLYDPTSVGVQYEGPGGPCS